MTTASSESIDTLIATNSRLEQRNAALEEQTRTLSRMAERLPQAEEEAKNARADKAALEQEIRLGGAQKAAKRIHKLITVVPNVIMLFIMAATIICFFSMFFMALPVGMVGFIMYPFVPFIGLFVISLRTSNKIFVRMFAVGMSVTNVLQNFGFQLGLLVAFTLVDTLRPYPMAVMVSFTSHQAVFTVVNTIMAILMRGITGEAGRLSGGARWKLTWAFMVERLGSKKKATFALLSSFGFFYPAWEGTALATKCEWPFSTRHMIKFVLRLVMITCLSSTVLLSIAPLYFLLAGGPEDFMPPPRLEHNFTATELDDYVAAARLSVIALAGFGPAFGLGVSIVYLLRRRIHAWLIGLATSGDAGRAAGVAAMVGKLEPQAVLGMARRTFTGLPFEVLRKEDFASNEDTGLNGKARRCRLGEVDAFLSHSWRDDAESKWQALSAWAFEFTETQGRSPIVWLDKGCLVQNQDIEAQLACLPVYLSGCQRFVLVAGETYQERIWCIIELFTFLRMGGTPDRVTLLPLLTTAAHRSPSDAEVDSMELADDDDGAMTEVFERFRRFEVSATKATKEEDRQHLLGVIEAGFGDLEVFNSLVQNLFDSLRQEHASQVEHASHVKRQVSRGSSVVAGLPRAPPKVMPAAS